MSQVTPDRWERISEIVAQALRRPDRRERARYLRQACAGDRALKREVEELLRLEDDDTSILAGPLLGRDIPQPAAVPPSPTLAPGQTVDRYRVERILGDGGMGTVALAHDPEVDRRVALKVIRHDKVSEESLRRFESERRILARLEHPAIARLLDAGTLVLEHSSPLPRGEGLGVRVPYFTLEYVDGEPIDAYCDRHRLGIEERLRLVLEICDALAEAHRHLVVHRDLKPGNVLVTADGQPKLLDFGIAKDLGPLAQAARTLTGVQPLTPAWASPEQVRGRPVGVGTDVYSLGLLLYRLLCGHPPHVLDGDAFDNVRRICEEEPPLPSEQTMVALEVWRDGAPVAIAPAALARARDSEPRALRRRLRGDLDAIVARALAKDEAARYRSIDALAEDLRRHLEGEPVLARRATLAYRAVKLARRHARALIAAALVMASLAAGWWTRYESRVRLLRVEVEQRRSAEQAERAEREAEALTGFARNLVLATDPDSGRTFTAREVLERARAAARRNLADEPEALAHQLEALGLVHQELRDLAAAGDLLSESLRLRREVYGRGDHPLVARGLNNLGVVAHFAADRPRAERLFRLALGMKRRLGQSADDLARVEDNLASLLAHRGALEEAEELYRRVLAAREERAEPNRAEIATSLRSLGNVLFLAGDFVAAEEYLRRALALRTEVHGTESVRTAAVWSSLGRVLHAQGRHEAARQAFERALDVRRERLGGEHVHVALTRKDLAGVLFELGESERAEHLWSRALEVLRARKPAGAWELADADSQHGGRLLAAGRIEEAEPLLVRGYETLRRERGEESLYTRQARARLAELRR